jgi:transcriptional regulator with XRE-family HTH domain
MRKQKARRAESHHPQTAHWTEHSTDDFLYRITADFIRQIESAMEALGVNQAELAKRLKVSEGRVSQILNNPGNLTLRKMVEYVRALGRKLAVVEYNDDDPTNQNGPVNSEIFATCWEREGMPTDFFKLENGATNITMCQIVPGTSTYRIDLPIAKKATNSTGGNRASDSTATTDRFQVEQSGVVNG